MPETIVLDQSSYSNTFGRFIVEPLERGYATTLGNSFRRVLLSSIPGWAFTHFRIPGALHEFSTIKGMSEDLVDFTLNLKGVRVKLIDKKLNKISLKLQGPMEFTAGEMQRQYPQIEVLNPEHHVATMSDSKEIEVELRIGRGKGYEPAEDHKLAEAPEDLVSIDALFSPIRNVRYFVQPTGVGEKTTLERLTLEVETDGSITPEDAVTTAAKMIQDHVQLFLNLGIHQEASEEGSAQEEEAARIRKLLKMSVDELELSVRAHNCLKAANIHTISELVNKDESELLRFRNFGRKSLAELAEKIGSMGLNFGMDVSKYLKDDNE
ncbi:MAG: DNA-directed RNA polymerase subunit alpha [Bacteroidetes bacterium]|jgi:DNA-directed RNA polymerase subunit alpha|nr:DNA-directed RNA polymerase subunit alpha [Bacteroidota bacterium]MCL5034009.1 DNA-directed RNA polymerase subunit alpha [Bacteroidota bacterium]